MLIEFLNFLNLKSDNVKQSVEIKEPKTNEEIEIADEEQTYKIIETEYKKSNNKTIKQTIEIVPIGNGKAIKRIKTQCVSRI